MTVVGDTSNLIPTFLQLAEQIKQRKANQAAALIGSLKPGESLGSVPGALEAYKRVTGHAGDPNRILVEQTLQQAMDRAGVQAWGGLSPDLQSALMKNKLINDAAGTQGVTTEGAYRTGQQTAETKAKGELSTAQSQAMSAEDFRTALAKIPPDQRAAFLTNQYINETTGTTGSQTLASAAAGRRTATAKSTAEAIATEAAVRGLQGVAPESEAERTQRLVGEKALFGQTTAETVAGAAKAGVEKQAADVASNFLSDPDNSAWGHFLKKNGYDPNAVTEAFATGQGTVLSGIQEEKVAKTNQRTALLTKQLDTQQKVDEARIRTAEEMSKTLSGRLGVRTILALENAVESGKDPYKIGVSPEDVQIWGKAREVGTTAYLRKAETENNPQVALVKQLMENQKSFTKPEQLQAANTVMGQLTASIMTTTELGYERPGPEDPQKQQLWDNRARFHYGTLAMTGKTPTKLWGMMGGKVGVTQNMPFMDPQFEVTTPGSTPATARESTKTTVPTQQTSTKGKGPPKFYDPDAARAVSGALAPLSDSTNMRQP